MREEITKDGRRVVYPSNALTDILTDVQRRGGVSASPPPAVRSGAWGEIKLSKEEEAELDSKLLALNAPVKAVEKTMPTKQEPQRRGNQPDFTNIQGVDIVAKTIWVDGLEFRMSDDEAKQLQRMCVDCVLRSVVRGLQGAVGDTLWPVKESTSERVKETTEVPEGHSVPREGEGTEVSVEKNESSEGDEHKSTVRFNF